MRGYSSCFPVIKGQIVRPLLMIFYSWHHNIRINHAAQDDAECMVPRPASSPPRGHLPSSTPVCLVNELEDAPCPACYLCRRDHWRHAATNDTTRSAGACGRPPPPSRHTARSHAPTTGSHVCVCQGVSRSIKTTCTHAGGGRVGRAGVMSGLQGQAPHLTRPDTHCGQRV